MQVYLYVQIGMHMCAYLENTDSQSYVHLAIRIDVCEVKYYLVEIAQ